MKITAKDIAREAGVSEATVSCVLNNRGNRISDKTREKVQEIANKYQFTCNPIAVSLATQRTNTIGLILPNLVNPFLSGLATGIEKVAREQKYALFLSNCEESAEQCIHYLDVFQVRRMEGIVVILPREQEVMSDYEKVFQALNQCRVPIILVEQYIDGLHCDYVAINNKEGGYLAAKYLIQMGHRRIGHIAGQQFTLQRTCGYLLALQESGITSGQALIEQGDFSIQSGYECAKKLLLKGVTAIFAGNDLMALGASRAAKEMGVRIPEDLSLVGFDDDPIAEVMEVPLTTIKQPGENMGAAACRILLHQIQAEHRYYENHYFNPELVIRKSVRAIP